MFRLEKGGGGSDRVWKFTDTYMEKKTDEIISIYIFFIIFFCTAFVIFFLFSSNVSHCITVSLIIKFFFFFSVHAMTTHFFSHLAGGNNFGPKYI